MMLTEDEYKEITIGLADLTSLESLKINLERFFLPDLYFTIFLIETQ